MVNTASPPGKFPVGKNPVASGRSGALQYVQSFIFTVNANLSAIAGKVNHKTYTFSAMAQAAYNSTFTSAVRLFTATANFSPFKAIVTSLPGTFTTTANFSPFKAIRSSLPGIFTATANFITQKQTNLFRTVTVLALVPLFIAKKALGSPHSFTSTAIAKYGPTQTGKIPIITALAGLTTSRLIKAIRLFSPLAQVILPTNITNGLILWWSMADGTLQDNSGNENPGVVQGTLTPAGLSVPALNFNTGDYATFTSTSSFIVQPGTTGITLAAWIQTTDFDAAIFSLRNAGSSIIDFGIGNDGLGNQSTGRPSVVMFDNGADALKELIAPTQVNDGFLHHLAFTFDTSQNMLIYIDGVASPNTINFGGSSNIIPDVNYSAVGAELRNSNIPAMKGAIGDVRIYNRALSASEINTVYLSQAKFIQVFKTVGQFVARAINNTTKNFMKTLLESLTAKALVPPKTIIKTPMFVVSALLLSPLKMLNKSINFGVIAQASVQKFITLVPILATTSTILTYTAQKVLIKTYSFATSALSISLKQAIKATTPIVTASVTSILKTVNKNSLFTILSSLVVGAKQIKAPVAFTTLTSLNVVKAITLVPIMATVAAKLSSLAQKLSTRTYSFTASALSSLLKQADKVESFTASAAINVFKQANRTLTFKALASLTNIKQVSRTFMTTALSKLTVSTQKAYLRTITFTGLASVSLLKVISRTTLFAALASFTSLKQTNRTLLAAFLAKTSIQKSPAKNYTFVSIAITKLGSKQIVKFVIGQVMIIAQVVKMLSKQPIIAKIISQSQTIKQANKNLKASITEIVTYLKPNVPSFHFTALAMFAPQKTVLKTYLATVSAFIMYFKERFKTLLHTINGLLSYTTASGHVHIQIILATVITLAQNSIFVQARQVITTIGHRLAPLANSVLKVTTTITSFWNKR